MTSGRVLRTTETNAGNLQIVGDEIRARPRVEVRLTDLQNGTPRREGPADARMPEVVASQDLLAAVTLFQDLTARLSEKFGVNLDCPLTEVPKKAWYTAAEVALETCRSSWQVRKWFREDRVSARKLPDGTWMVSYEELVRYKYERLRPAS